MHSLMCGVLLLLLFVCLFFPFLYRYCLSASKVVHTFNQSTWEADPRITASSKPPWTTQQDFNSNTTTKPPKLPHSSR
ncbi:hypothetical protein LEMLEM_LOCUS9507 [Lemmus lemmus]